MWRRRLMRRVAISLRLGIFVPLLCVPLALYGAEEGKRELTGEPGMLLLRNGAVIEGRILKAGENYTVQRPNGDMFVPGVMVRLQCATLGEIYKKLHGTAEKDDTGEARVALARWCITNKLLKEARRELTDAMEFEPSRTEARDMLQKLDLTLDPPADSKKSIVDPTKSAPATARYSPDEVESLGGLSRESGQQFMRRIQPMLVNNCAVGGCHGPNSEFGFRLQRVVPGADTSRLASERNLAEILEQIDYKSPRQSPILTIPGPSHGRRGKPAFGGPRGTDQLAELKKFILEVARSDAGRSRRDTIARRDKPEDDSIRQASASEDRKKARPAEKRSSVRHAHAEEPGPQGEANDPLGIRKAARGEKARDPFDATEFNQGTSRPRN